jgi:hypothetical protein
VKPETKAKLDEIIEYERSIDRNTGLPTMRDMTLTSRTSGYGWDDVWIVIGSQQGHYDRGMPEHCTAQFRRAPCYEPMDLSRKVRSQQIKELEVV